MTIPEHSALTSPPDASAGSHAFDYLRVSVTDRCQLSSAYCRPSHEPQPPRRLLACAQLVACCAAICAAAPIRKIRLSGGEPLLRPDLPELIISLTDLPNRPEVTLTTNGLLLAARAGELAAVGLSRLNVSLDTADHASYQRLTQSPALDQVLCGLEAAAAAGFRGTKLNAVLLSSLGTRELQDLLTVAADHGAMLRLIELMPLGLAPAFVATHHVSFEGAVQRVTAAAEAVTEPTQSGPAAHPRLLATLADGRTVTVELLAPMSRPCCRDCRRLRLSCDGQLIPCLLSPARVPFVDEQQRPPDASTVRTLLHRCATLKRRADDLTTQRMWAIGG